MPATTIAYGSWPSAAGCRGTGGIAQLVVPHHEQGVALRRRQGEHVHRLPAGEPFGRQARGQRAHA